MNNDQMKQRYENKTPTTKKQEVNKEVNYGYCNRRQKIRG